MMTNRRQFIKKSSLGLMGAYLGSSLLSSCDGNQSSKGNGPFANIGLQIYSVRDLLLQDPKLTLETVAKIGYSHIETFGVDVVNNSFWGLKVPELKKYLSDINLATHTGHYDMGRYLDRNSTDKESIEKYIDIAKELGQSYIVAPVPPMHDLNNLTVDDYKYAAEQLNKAGELAKKSGLKVAYHNHFWEFREFANGTKGLDILLAFTEPELVTFELDIFWIEKAGFNAQSYFKKFPGRFAIWHVKDMSKSNTTAIVGKEFDKLPIDSIMQQVKYTEVGTGTINYPILKESEQESGLKLAFVEQDDIYIPNKFESIQKSYQYVQKYLVK